MLSQAQLALVRATASLKIQTDLYRRFLDARGAPPVKPRPKSNKKR